jgi:hypothetical protein
LRRPATRRPAPRTRRFLVLTLVALVAGAAGIAARARAAELVDWHDLEPHQLRSTYIRTDHDITLEVDAIATFDRDSWRPIAYPWILDAYTRRVRWTVDPERPQTRLKRRGRAVAARVDADTVQLASGSYEIYFATFGDRYQDLPQVKIWGNLESWLKKHAIDMADEWALRIRCDDDDREAVTVGHPAKPTFDALLRIPHPGDSAYEYELFKVDAPVEVLVYAIGEYDRDGRQFSDSGWIAEAKTRRPVWEMTRRNTRAAGGAAKNRRFRDFVHLDPGVYMLGYSSDDSHSYGDWNLNPPADPEFWGIALFDPRGDVATHFTAPVEDPFRSTVLIDIDRQRNSSFASRGLRVKEPVDLFIMALGEYDDTNERFVDGGWIEKRDSMERVWEMTRFNTRPAGGAQKNRMAEETVHLPTGEYVVCYVTDGSHAYRSWNGPPPRYPDRWGIQVSLLGGDADRQRVELFDPSRDDALLVNLVAIGDNSDANQRFVLDEPTTVRIVSIGEGLHGHMFDYGRLRRLGDGARQSRLVWKMLYEETRHAGGAEKNRIAEEVMELPAGTYEADFVSDDSHAFGSWNAAPPDQPHLWGIRIYRVTR